MQGVGFRFFTEAQAQALNLTGWVRNEPDGSVSLVAEGPEEALHTLVQALESGPPSSRVERVHAAWGEGAGSFNRFSIRR